ncbi:tRNA-splicing endonuclease subunit Sen2 [Pungitius pungitius]|uniref:tRNA-splicing endonuclease subunit Sen2 n=1 Tax=Pungitius pungitius TaxID=134920 RepID=UPI002E105959
MQAEFRAPRRRTRVQEEYVAPLPVSRSPGERSHFRAELLNQHVLVRHPDHIQSIYNQGYFGKGVLSRARPDHSISYQWEQYEGLFLPVISRSRYEELLRWAGSALSAQGLDEDAVNQTLLSLSRPVEMEDVRKEMSRGEEAGPNGGACPRAKRSGSGVGPKAKRSCRLDRQNHNSDPDSDQNHDHDSDPDPNPSSDPDPSSDQNLEPDPDASSDQNLDPDASSDQNLDPDPDASSDQELDPYPDLSSDQEVDPDLNSDSDSDVDPLVPGPGFVLVVSDSEVCGGVREVRRTPFSLTEYLQLSLEEAFFLVYSLGCLSVYLKQEPLSIIQLWRRFRSLRPDFVSSFAAYQHCRSRGWVPKVGGGAKYGVDLMLYRKGPPFYHASYSVVIERTDDTFRGSALRPFSWRSLAALSRITSNVSKELMLCYIIYPANLSEAELDSPVCLGRLKVQEVIVNRWVSSKERAEQDDV